jgi:hypothetical protein
MKNILVLFVFFTLSASVTAQNSVSYDLEPGLDQVEEKHQEAWSKVKKVEGYRIQLIALSGSNSKAVVEKMQADFLAIFTARSEAESLASAAVFIGVCEKAVTAVKNSTHEIIVFFMVIQIIIKKLYDTKSQYLRQK